MQRILRSQFQVAASAASATYTSDIVQADLEAAVPVGGAIMPFALQFSEPGTAGEVTVESLVLGNTKNDENKANVLPKGTGVRLADVNAVTNPQGGGIDSPSFPVSHGARLTVIASNSVASPKVVTVLWKVLNQFGEERLHPPFPGRSAGEAAEIMSGGRAFGPPTAVFPQPFNIYPWRERVNL